MPILKVNKEISDRIKILYEQGNHMYEIGNLLNLSTGTIFYHLKKQNILTRGVNTSAKTLSFNEDYFENINTEDRAYFLGLLMADGCNTRSGLSIYIAEKDAAILSVFSKCINYTGTLKFLKKRRDTQQNQIYINLHSREFSKKLSSVGIPPKKTEILEFPCIDENLIHHFIRGYFDGDGSIGTYNNNKVFTIAGNKSFIEKLQFILIKNCCLNKTKIKDTKNKNIGVFSYCGNIQNNRIKEFLYKDATIYMERKYDKFINN